MRPPILYLTIAFAAGLAPALTGADLRVAALLVLCGVALLLRRAPFASALGLMLVAGICWGGAARRAQDASCAGRHVRAAIVELSDPVSSSGGVVEGVARES